MTVLHSSPRQSELSPILCAIANFELSTGSVDKLFGFPEGETELLLQGLHSVLRVPSKGYDGISSHHASFLDFLNDPDRSQIFYISSLDRRMVLARSLLKICAGDPKECSDLFLSRVVSNNLIPFITSLAPTAELCPLIELMNDEYILEMTCDLECMSSWIKNIPSAPRVLVERWEKYTTISSEQTSVLSPEFYSRAPSNAHAALSTTGADRNHGKRRGLRHSVHERRSAVTERRLF
ncbi:hypothetical protein MSAN_00494700 [Mycena sanguinolenta]|uniref:Uncharacterized protein n=1 Tax=Mycena sanguinolenta TaxID=230812 RepID=A0A8H6Z5D4_9AGAR|nr:hypothetical protein MSAN_00494700 [Mycena sanguinolenta]